MATAPPAQFDTKEAVPAYPVAPQPTGPYPIAPQPTGPYPVDPNAQAAAAAMAGQQYRDALLAQCAQGVHERKTEYGIFGIIMAIACFPCGLIALFLDTNNKCARCGISLP